MIDREIIADATVDLNAGGDANHKSSGRARLVGESLQLENRVSLSQQLQLRVRKNVGAELDGVEQLIQTATRSRYPQVESISGRAAVLGGKRLRPILVLLASQVVRRDSRSDAQIKDLTSVAAAVELVHAASLVHDDVMDGADQRRHQSTIMRQEGNAAAVLFGDFLFTRAYAIAASCNSTYVARQIASAATQLCEGELRQQASARDWDLSLRDYRSILVQKTAALCAVSCRLGAWLAGATTEQRQALASFGTSLGLAFQIYDDWLDYWGSEQVGKTLGTDLAQGKPTLPLIRLLKTASRQQGHRLRELLRTGSVDGIAELRHELDRSDAAEYTLAIARRCVCKAQSKLACLPSSSAKDCLHAVAEFSVNRAV